jgi:hypothetical protein
MKEIWFKRKTYGYGWTPVSKEGWIVTIVAILLILKFATDTKTNPIKSMIYIFLTVITLVIICYKTGEKPKWHWGKDKKK